MMYDVLVIGAGPAGLSAAVNVRQRGGSVLVAGLPPEGNPLWKAEKIDNYLGLPGMTGKEMMETFRAHAEGMGVEFNENRVLNAFYSGSSWMLSAGSDVLEGLTVVFAGGITRGKPFEGEEAYIGAGVSYCATCDGMLYRGKDVAVIGFGESDREEAEYLTGIGCKVEYFERPKNVKILGDTRVGSVLIDGTEYKVSCVFILRPSLAPTKLFPGLELDGTFIRTDRNMATNLEGLYAAGDCTGTPLQVSRAVGEGLIAGQMAMAEAARRKKEGMEENK